MKLKIATVLLLYCSLASAQLNDLARIDFTIIPAGNSGIEYNRIRYPPQNLCKVGRQCF